jgi:hypothetical protein
MAQKNKFALIVTLAAVLVSCDGDCTDENVAQYPSPDGKLVATVFIRDCGAAGAAASRVSLHEAGGAYDDDDDGIFSASREQTISVKWTDNKHLTIYCAPCDAAEITTQVSSYRGVEIKGPRR